MSFFFYEMAKNPHIQRKVQMEITRFSNSGNLTYESLLEMKYLDCCINETMRKYPAGPLLVRVCSEDFEIPGTHLVVEKGTVVMIPVLALHRDPEIFEDPMKFKPERFLNSPNGSGKGTGSFYLPFGDGPRNCIGLRLARLMMKLGIAIVLSKFSVELTDKTMAESELEFDVAQFILTQKKFFKLKLTPQ